MKFIKQNLITVIIISSTVILAGIAIFTAIRLYQLRQKPVAPSVPESQPQACIDGDCGEEIDTSCEALTFTIITPEYDCNLPCTDNSQCQAVNPDYICYNAGGTTGKVCRLEDNTSSTTCQPAKTTASPTPTLTPTPTGTSGPTSTPTGTSGPTSTPTATATAAPHSAATSTPEAGLPPAGIPLPTLIGAGAGIILLIGALLLAL